MNSTISWYSGLNNFKKNTLDLSQPKTFTVELVDKDFDPNRTIDSIMLDHLKNRQTKTVEVLYSGGLDSEFVLSFCLRNNIPVEANTLVIKIKGAILNVIDLYYSEKFCRENNVKHNLFVLDPFELYASGQYLEYLLPYHITEPHVASHFWLLDRCQNYPILGGDWPWVHAHLLQDKILSPHRIDFACYDKYMSDKGISGIGNMIGHSLESCCHFIKNHIDSYESGNDTNETAAFLKFKMYNSKLYTLKEPRLRSYGWEQCPKKLFNLINYKAILLSKIGKISHKIKWGNTIKNILQTSLEESSEFS